MNEAEPNWDLLPHRSEEFFGLEPGYDLRDLRRAYTVFIRRFKPETSPAEFQRIRFAYECLHESLRYGKLELDFPETRQFDWGNAGQPRPFEFHAESKTESNEQTEAESDNSDSREQEWNASILARLSETNAVDLYREAQNRKTKSPADYYVLALLSEVVDDDPLSFARWLLAGLAEHRDESGLFCLLQEYLAEARPSALSLELLELTSRSVQTDRFYRLTERLWMQLLREIQFDVFQTALAQCESQIVDLESENQTVFYLRLLRTAIWRDDGDWFEQKFRQVESMYQELPAWWGQQELEFLDRLRVYQIRRSEFIRRGAIQKRIDQAIIDFCSHDELKADQIFLECQHILTANSDELMRDFPIPSPNTSSVILVWEWIADDVAQRVLETPASTSAELRQNRISGLAISLVEAGERTPFSAMSQTFQFSVGLLMFVILGLLMYGGYIVIVDLFFQVHVFQGLCHFLVYCGLILVAIPFGLIFLAFDGWIVHKYYRLIWRRLILQFFETGPYSINEIVSELSRLDEQTVHGISITNTKKIAEILATDLAVRFHVTALRLLRS